jgi:hypothetical protein
VWGGVCWRMFRGMFVLEKGGLHWDWVCLFVLALRGFAYLIFMFSVLDTMLFALCLVWTMHSQFIDKER